jgi:lysophospholipase
MTASQVRRTRLIGAVLLALVVAAIVLALVGAAGGDNRDVFADSRPPPDLPERFYPPEDWAWGEVQAVGGPVQRYGVSAPSTAPRADVLILPDYGESAETWFETARELNAAGYVVWVLEGVGQGGSARLSGHRDLGELRNFDADLAGVQAMIDPMIRPAPVIRPDPGRPLVLLGQGVGALIAARVAERRSSAAGVVLSEPRCAGGSAGGALVYLGLGAIRAPGAEAWARVGRNDFAAHRTHDAWRGAVTHAWQTANPDLRMGGPSLDWGVALARLQRDAEAGAGSLKTPTLVIDDGKPRACLAPPVAVRRSLVGADPALELEDDRWRRPWLAAVLAFLGEVAEPARN